MTAETPGKVVLSGQSSLRLAGDYLEVSDLVFRDGYTPRGEVISFRRDSNNLASHSRVTRVVIDNYSNPDRTQTVIWVALFGRNNTLDHNHFEGKTDAGPTVAVRLDTEASQNNNHQIRYNYFGPRPVFGSNGGESLRIGTSPYSLTRSETVVEDNFFDRCNGEVEIISNKSGGNVYRRNTFFESSGTLTLRHGSDTLVENNLFDGNGAPFTGGVRIINERQTVRNNYFRRLTGTRFSGALVVMNGVPNSPINRYNQVDGAVIEGNTFEGVAAIELAEGSDAERTAVPVNSVFRNNLIADANATSLFRIHDDLSGLAFIGNVAAEAPPAVIASGFRILAVPVRVDGAKTLAPVGDAGARGPFGVAKEETGVLWYPKTSPHSPFSGGRTIAVSAGEDTISNALGGATPGDVLMLAPGRYMESKFIELKAPVTIMAADGANGAAGQVELDFQRSTLFVLSGKGSLRMSGITVLGAEAPDATGNSFLISSWQGGRSNHIVEFENMKFSDFDVNNSFSIIKAAKGTFFDRVLIANSRFESLSGSVLKLDAETDDYGIYSAEFVSLTGNTFANIREPVVSIYRGGTDESTFGPNVTVSGSTFSAIGGGRAPMLELHGIQGLVFTDNTIRDAKAARLTITTGKPVVDVSGNTVAGDAAVSALTIIDLRAVK
jgi:poly(beta-D-mannuronate) lyase